MTLSAYPAMVKKRESLYAVLVALAVFTLIGLLAARSDEPSQPLVVNSTADDQDDDGECTLREAIIASNTDRASGATEGECLAGSGDDVIAFDLGGPPDFTNRGRNGYSIVPTAVLPDITDTVTIDGFAQLGASENMAVSPSPFDAMLLVELDGSSVVAGDGHGLDFAVSADNSVVRGLVINRFAHTHARALYLRSTVTIQGNYVGTDPTGLVALPNNAAISSDDDVGSQADDVLIGGLDPGDRNVLSGNADAGIGQLTDANDWLIQGNYIGVAADGTTPMGNLAAGATIDRTSGTKFGGTETGSANLVSGNRDSGLAPDDVDGVAILNNYIGTDFTGTVRLPNGNHGVSIGRGSVNVVIGGSGDETANTICFNRRDGVNVWGGSSGVAIRNNVIVGNEGHAISVERHSSDVEVIGNLMRASGRHGVYLEETSGIKIAANSVIASGGHGISLSEGVGETLIGGVRASDANIIASNAEHGIDHRFQPGTSALSLLGNEIHSNGGLGFALTYDSPWANDYHDVDSGPNGLLNHPERLRERENGGEWTVEYELDVPAGEYRVEFFANTAPDDSGYGEGERLVGSHLITHRGSGAQAFAGAIAGSGVENVTATVTVVDGSTNGFGATSEFSASAGG